MFGVFPRLKARPKPSFGLLILILLRFLMILHNGKMIILMKFISGGYFHKFKNFKLFKLDQEAILAVLKLPD